MRGHLWGDTVDAAFGSPGTGVGRHELCETCGETGAGAAADPVPAPGDEDASSGGSCATAPGSSPPLALSLLGALLGLAAFARRPGGGTRRAGRA